MSSESVCPCGSLQSYELCCAPYHRQESFAADACILMKSRYSAFCLQHYPYLLQTWHPETRPDDLSEEEPHQWVKLEIEAFEEDDEEAMVRFKAYLIHEDQLETLYEESYFDLIDGRWFYHSGEFIDDHLPAKKLKPKMPCPCASGQSYETCHGRKSKR